MAERSGKRADGEGSIRERKPGQWEARISLPNGGRKSVYGKTRTEVVKKLKQAQKEQSMGRDLSKRRERVGDHLDRWLADVAAQRMGPKTLHRYGEIIRLHIAPALGRHYLDDLTPQHVRSLLARKKSDGLSAGTVSYIRAVLRSALAEAVRWGLVARNVAALATPPKADRKRFTPLTKEQTQELIAACEGHHYGAAFVTTAATGVRQGELLALRWCDIDLDAKRLHVRRALKVVRGEFIFGEPKSRTSRRAVPLPAVAVASLRRHRAASKRAALASGKAWNEEQLVFCKDDGRPYDGRTLTHAFQRLIEREGLPRVRMPDLRHGAATLMLQSGVGMAVVKDVLGHSTVQVTIDYYAHVAEAVRQEAAKALNDALGGATGTGG